MVNLITIIIAFILYDDILNHFQDSLIYVSSYKSDGYGFKLRPGFKDNLNPFQSFIKSKK
jgi:hypothetical protein